MLVSDESLRERRLVSRRSGHGIVACLLSRVFSSVASEFCRDLLQFRNSWLAQRCTSKEHATSCEDGRCKQTACAFGVEQLIATAGFFIQPQRLCSIRSQSADYFLTRSFTIIPTAPLPHIGSESASHQVRSFPVSQARGATPLGPSSAVAHLTLNPSSSLRTARHDDESSARSHL
jgi:hypothetical protein